MSISKQLGVFASGLILSYGTAAYIYDQSHRDGKPVKSQEKVICEGSLQDKATQAAARHAIPQSLFSALITAESAWNPSAVSSAGARGLGQVMPKTGKQFCQLDKNELFDSCKNLECSASYLAHLKSKTGNWKQAVQSYNAGYKRIMVDKVIPKDTVQYVQKIRNFGGNI